MLREVPAGQREPKCDTLVVRSNRIAMQCVDCTWPCATLVAATTCTCACTCACTCTCCTCTCCACMLYVWDHLNEHSLLEQPAWLPGTIPGIWHQQQKGSIDSRIRSVSAMAGLCYAHETRVLTAICVVCQRRDRHRATAGHL